MNRTMKLLKSLYQKVFFKDLRAVCQKLAFYSLMNYFGFINVDQTIIQANLVKNYCKNSLAV